MIVIKAYMDTNYVDGDRNRTIYILYDNNTDFHIIHKDITEKANEFFEEHEYLAQGYNYIDGWDSEEDEQSYYDNCWYDFTQITEEQMMKEIRAEYGDVAEAEVYDRRTKEKE